MKRYIKSIIFGIMYSLSKNKEVVDLGKEQTFVTFSINKKIYGAILKKDKFIGYGLIEDLS